MSCYKISQMFTKLVFSTCLMNLLLTVENVSADMDSKLEERAVKNHQIDSLNLMVYICLLILTILTIWLFKHHRFRFVHETGLAVIYGLIIGAIINYTIGPSSKTYEVVDLAHENSSDPPDILKLQIKDTSGNTTSFYQYSYQSQIGKETFTEAELEEKATFDPEVFFNVILPPIIFNAGYQMKRKHFFKNFGAIVTFAFLGTTISSFVVGGLMYAFCLMVPATLATQLGSLAFNDCLLFGAIISATDPVTVLAIFHDLNVDVDLYALVFGESVLNDAVAIVLASTVENYKSSTTGFDGFAVLKCLGYFLEVFFCSFLLGSGMGCVTAVLTKYTHIQDFPLLETSLFVLMSYGTFLAAEALSLTGIVAVLFCGICQAHYTFNNLSKASQSRTKEVFELLNFLMENFVFTYIGVSTFTFRKHSWDAGFIFYAMFAMLVGRACHIYPLSFLLNLGRSNKIGFNFQHVMMFSGLRGAMAFALAMRNTSSIARQTILSTTLVIVIVTVVLCGGFTTQVLLWLKIRVGVEEETELQNFDSMRPSRQYSALHGLPEISDSSVNSSSNDVVHVDQTSRLAGKARLVRVWYRIDSRFVKPFLTNSRPPLTETLPKCCLPLGRLLTTTEQLMQTDHDNHVDHDGFDSDMDHVIGDSDHVINSISENSMTISRDQA